MIQRSKKWWTSRIDAEPDVPISAGYAVYRPTLSERFWRDVLGFHSPKPKMLTPEQLKLGWNEEVFVNTYLHVSFPDRLRLLLTGRAKVFTIVSARVQVPEAITSVSFAVARPGAA